MPPSLWPGVRPAARASAGLLPGIDIRSLPGLAAGDNRKTTQNIFSAIAVERLRPPPPPA